MTRRHPAARHCVLCPIAHMLSRRIPWHLKFLILVASALRAFPVAPMTGFRSPSVCWPACACGWLWGRSLTQSCPTGSACSQACGCRPCACSASPRWSPTHPGEALPGIRACARRPVHRQAVPKVGNRWISTIYCIFSDFSITFETACRGAFSHWSSRAEESRGLYGIRRATHEGLHGGGVRCAAYEPRQ